MAPNLKTLDCLDVADETLSTLRKVVSNKSFVNLENLVEVSSTLRKVVSHKCFYNLASLSVQGPDHSVTSQISTSLAVPHTCWDWNVEIDEATPVYASILSAQSDVPVDYWDERTHEVELESDDYWKEYSPPRHYGDVAQILLTKSERQKYWDEQSFGTETENEAYWYNGNDAVVASKAVLQKYLRANVTKQLPNYWDEATYEARTEADEYWYEPNDVNTISESFLQLTRNDRVAYWDENSYETPKNVDYWHWQSPALVQ